MLFLDKSVSLRADLCDLRFMSLYLSLENLVLLQQFYLVSQITAVRLIVTQQLALLFLHPGHLLASVLQKVLLENMTEHYMDSTLLPV